MKHILGALYAIAFAMMFSGVASAQNCGPCQVDSDCGSGKSCCYTQYSNGSISCNFCKTGGCVTTSTKKDLIGAKEHDATTLKQDKLPKANEASAQNCGPCQVDSDCGSGKSCCYTQYSNGSISCNFCKTGGCVTTSTKKDLIGAKEHDATTLKQDKLPKANEASAQNCGPCQVDSDCGSGKSCCYTQYSNGSISCNFCKTGSCVTTSTKKDLIGAKELDATTFKKGKDANSPKTEK